MKRFFIFLFIIFILFSSFADEIIDNTIQIQGAEEIQEVIEIEPLEQIGEELIETEPLEQIEDVESSEQIDEDSNETPIEILPIEQVSIEFNPEEDETIYIEENQPEPDTAPSVRFRSSHAGKLVEEGTKITLTASVEGIEGDYTIYWEYSDDDGMTSHRFAEGKTCTIIAYKDNYNWLYRAIVELPE